MATSAPHGETHFVPAHRTGTPQLMECDRVKPLALPMSPLVLLLPQRPIEREARGLQSHHEGTRGREDRAHPPGQAGWQDHVEGGGRRLPDRQVRTVKAENGRTLRGKQRKGRDDHVHSQHEKTESARHTNCTSAGGKVRVRRAHRADRTCLLLVVRMRSQGESVALFVASVKEPHRAPQLRSYAPQSAPLVRFSVRPVRVAQACALAAF